MSWLELSIIIVIVLFFLWRMMPTKGISHITPEELKQKLKQKDIQLIDVRTPSEFKARNIKAFINVPLNTLNNSSVTKLSKEKEVIVICQSGMRSNKASKLLKKLGFRKVTNVKGGMNAWM